MTTGPTGKRLPRAVREQQMLDAAVAVFSRRGFHAAGMDEIAEEAGISKPMVYAYLGTKEELFVACLHREATRLMEAIARVVEPDLPPDEQLWRGIRAFFGFVAGHRDGWGVLYRQARGQEPFAAELAGMRRRMIEVVAGLLERAVTRAADASGGTGAKRPAPGRDLTAMAYALVGVAESLADWAAEHPDEDAEVTAARMMNFVWLGADARLRGASWRPSTCRDSPAA
ncbi:MAG TPA: TetR/AcrR family transcriptional regulator [Micromonosporaceae bacterium]|nr:TetR/AcrR family transcriptional regulator [Micromonosporaceae bacterium]